MVSLPVPAVEKVSTSSFGRLASVVITRIAVAGQDVDACFPLQIRVFRGMRSPLHLPNERNRQLSTPTFVVDDAWALAVPNLYSPTVDVFGADGSPAVSLNVADYNLSTRVRTAAFCATSGALLLADDYGSDSRLVAVDIANQRLRWSSGLTGDCCGIAVLSAEGVAVLGDFSNRQLHVHRLSDGVRVATSPVDISVVFTVADPVGAVVFASSKSIIAQRWDGVSLVADGVVAIPDSRTGANLPLAVVPSSLNYPTCLVVGTVDDSEVFIFALPDRRLVHRHTLRGIMVSGLAADPTGTALAVCDSAAKGVHVLAWPLPGMPSSF
jgi:hypothetical protein